MTPLKLWMKAATVAEQKLLARQTGTTHAYLYHLCADDDSAYKREPKPELAARIETTVHQMHKASKGRLPLVYRTDLVKACAQCAFARKCLGSIALRGEFDIVTKEMIDDSE